MYTLQPKTFREITVAKLLIVSLVEKEVRLIGLKEWDPANEKCSRVAFESVLCSHLTYCNLFHIKKI